MKIALASAPVKTGNMEFNMASMLAAMRDVRGKADVIVFGESVLQGFDSLVFKNLLGEDAKFLGRKALCRGIACRKSDDARIGQALEDLTNRRGLHGF